MTTQEKADSGIRKIFEKIEALPKSKQRQRLNLLTMTGLDVPAMLLRWAEIKNN